MCVLVLADETGALNAVSVFEGRRSLSRRLMGEVDSLLTRNGITLNDLSAFAVGLGPGSFTGVRVGVTTAKTWAQVTGKPLVGVGTLDAYASVWLTHHDHTYIVPVLPSRRGEVYAVVYRNGKPEGEPFAASLEEMTARLRAMLGAVVCGEPQLLPEWGGPALRQPWTPRKVWQPLPPGVWQQATRMTHWAWCRCTWSRRLSVRRRTHPSRLRLPRFGMGGLPRWTRTLPGRIHDAGPLPVL